MNLIDDQQLQELYAARMIRGVVEEGQGKATDRRQLALARGLASHNVPLLRGRDDDLRVRNLRLRKLHITYQS